MWAVLAALAAAALAAVWLARQTRRLRVREAERRAAVTARAQERERARRVLEGDVQELADPPVPLRDGERAYYLAPAAQLEPDEAGGFRRRARGEVLVTNRAVYFLAEGRVLLRQPVQEVERVDIPYSNVIALVSFRDTITRDEARLYFEVREPLVMAAHISRFTAFELILT